MTEPTLYLASGSPRRRQLLGDAGIHFVQHAVPVNEEELAAAYSGPLEALGEYLAIHKAQAARRDLIEQGRNGLVLASDTTVLFKGQSLPKPADAIAAAEMLRALRGQEHVVATGVALAQTASAAFRSATALTRVRMRDVGDDEIRAYIATGDPLDKAGGYSIQHPEFRPVASYSGCYLGVVGLPLCIVASMLGGGTRQPARKSAADSARDNGCAGCVWSARCTPPFPGPDIMETGCHDCRTD